MEEFIQGAEASPLSAAQQKRYAALLDEYQQAAKRVQEFTAFLAEEHAIAGDGWILHADRFERDAPDDPPTYPHPFEPGDVVELAKQQG